VSPPITLLHKPGWHESASQPSYIFHSALFIHPITPFRLFIPLPLSVSGLEDDNRLLPFHSCAERARSHRSRG
jgi:hypothetical protein